MYIQIYFHILKMRIRSVCYVGHCIMHPIVVLHYLWAFFAGAARICDSIVLCLIHNWNTGKAYASYNILFICTMYGTSTAWYRSFNVFCLYDSSTIYFALDRILEAFVNIKKIEFKSSVGEIPLVLRAVGRTPETKIVSTIKWINTQRKLRYHS